MEAKEVAMLKGVVDNEYCDFYKRLYDGVDLTNWKEIPCFSREDIVKYEEDGRKFLFVDEKDVVDVTTTSGTSDTSMSVYLSKKDKESRDEKMLVHIKENYPDDARIISVFTSNFAGKHPKSYEKYVNIEGDIYDLGYTAELIQKMNINALRTSPTVALKLGEILEIVGYDKIKLFVSNGEPISDLMAKQIKRKFLGVEISMLCGMSEFSNTGWQCKKLYGSRLFHTLPDYIKYEVLTEDGEIKSKGEGELVLTGLWKGSAFPLVRYRTGDRALLSENKCECGAKGIMLSLLGRVNLEGIRVGGITLHKKNIDEAIVSLNRGEEYQVHVYEEKKQDKIFPKLVFCFKGEKEEGLEDKLMENLMLTPSYNWRAGVEMNSLLPLEIKFVKELERRGSKTPNVIDYRIKEVRP